MKKWLVGLVCVGMWAGAAWADLSSPATLPVEYAGANGWSNANLDAMTGWDATGLAAPYANSAKFDGAGDKVVIYFDGAPDDIVYSVRRSDNAVLEGPYSATVQESADNSTWSTVRTFDGTELDGTLKTFTNTLATASRYVKFEFVTKPTGQNFGLGYVNVAAGGPAVFGVNLNRQNGFEVEQGASDAITATAASGTEPYSYEWATDMAAGDYNVAGNVFTISATAALGDYSATVTATDSADPQHQAEKAVTFSVVAPAIKYAITITDPVNGTVTTTPATEAEAGATVTINATPAGGFAAGTKTVIAQDSTSITVTGNTFTMPAQPVTVTVTFIEASASGELIISQYYEGTSNNKWIEIYNPGATAIDLAAAGYRLGQFSNSNRELWKTDGTPSLTVVLSNTIAAGGTYLVSHTAATNPVYAVAGQKAGLVHNGDDTTVLYTGATYSFANVVDAMGWVTASGAADTSFVRKNTVTTGVNTDFNAADWDVFTLAAVEAAGAAANEYVGYHSTGPAVFGVNVDKANGFTVAQGTSAAITATAQNGTETYNYTWGTTMAAGDYSAVGNVFTILATAALGNDYTATVTATDSSDPQQQAEKTVTFSVVAPAIKYAITITAPVNGSVTTTPATEAEAGQTVTVNATPDANYAVGVIQVNGGAVTVTGTTFVMPAEPVTVAVTFVEVVAEGIVDFRFNNAPYLPVTAKDANLAVTDMALTAGTIETAITTGTYFTDEPYVEETGGWTATSQAEAKAFVFTITPAEGSSITIDGISFNAYATAAGPSAFGFDIGGGTSSFEVNAPSAVLLSVSQAVVGVENATGAIEVKIQGWLNGSRESTGSGVFRLDDVVIHGTVYSGPPVFSVSLDKSNGFTVNEGSTATIVATAANGEAPYTWEWTTDLPVGTYNAPGGAEPGGKSFFIQNNAPTGTYYATATATDNTSATAQKTVTFSVVGLPVGEPAVIISGNLSGTVGVQMNLAISITNETATDWFIDLVDPDALADTTYGFDGSTFTLTPAKAGTYVLTATAQTSGGNVSNTVNLVISGGGGELPNITEFEVPAGATASATLATTTVGKTYKLQYTTNLLAVPVVWQDADTQAGTGGEITLQDGDPADMARYYRVTEN